MRCLDNSAFSARELVWLYEHTILMMLVALCVCAHYLNYIVSKKSCYDRLMLFCSAMFVIGSVAVASCLRAELLSRLS